MTSSPQGKLKLIDATMPVMGGIIGIGIFSTPADIAREVPTEGAYLAMWGIGTLAALCGAQCPAACVFMQSWKLALYQLSYGRVRSERVRTFTCHAAKRSPAPPTASSLVLSTLIPTASDAQHLRP